MKKIFILLLVLMLSMISFVSAFPTWTTGQTYSIGDIVSYNGQDYICIQAHTSQAGWTPPVVPALWNVYIADFQNGDPWISGYAFSVNDITEYQGIYYRVIQAHTSQSGWTPPQVPALFEPLLYFENNKPILQKNDISIQYNEVFNPSLNEMIEGFETSRAGFGYIVSVDSENYPNLNKSAIITIEDTYFNSTPRVYKIIEFDETYPPNSTMQEVAVTRTLNQNGDFIFEVDEFSMYFVQDEYTDDIRDNRATAVVSGDPDTLAYLDVWVRIRETGSSWGTWTTGTTRITELETALSFTMTGLSENTGYDWQAVGYHNPTNTLVFSNVVDFTTKYDYSPARIYDEPADNIVDNGARLKGELSLREHNGADVRFSYRKQGSSTWVYTSYVEYFTDGIKTQTITGLDSNQVYEFRSHVRYYGEDYGGNTNTYPSVETEATDTSSTETFTTTGTSTPQVTTLTADNIAITGARLRGTLDDLGGETAVNMYFDYKLTSAGTWTSTTLTEFTGTGTHTQSLSGLTTDVEYQFKVCVDYDTTETNCGDVRTFIPRDLSVYDLTEGLVSYWKFDETSGTTADDSHSTNDATASSASWTSSGKINGAYNFDDGSDTIDLNNKFSFVNNDGLFTFSMWWKPTDYTLTNNQFIISSTGTSAHKGFFIFFDATDDKIVFQSSTGSIWGSQTFSASNSINSNDWYHIVVVGDGTDAQIYINGASSGSSNTINKSTGDNTNNAIIGAIPDLIRFNGNFDEVAIYDRALSSDEITLLYGESGAGLPYGDFVSIGTTLKETPEISLGGSLSELSYNSVTLEATGYFGQYSEVDVTFEYRETSSSTWIDTNSVNIKDSFTKDTWLSVTNGDVQIGDSIDFPGEIFLAVNIPLSGLDDDTEYEYRVRLNHHIDNYIGSETGSTASIIDEETPQRTFTTLELPPTDVPSLSGLGANLPLINDGTATLEINVNLNGYSEGKVYFKYKKQSEGTYTQTSKSTITGNGIVLIDITGLSEETTYDLFALIDHLETDYEGTNFGSDGTIETTASTFTTGEGGILAEFVLETNNATLITENGARLNAIINSMGDYEYIDTYFRYIVNDFVWIETTPVNFTGLGSPAYDLTGLLSGSDVDFQICGTNNITLCGETLSFSTSGEPSTNPVIETRQPTELNDTGAKLEGFIASMGTQESIDIYFKYRVLGLVWVNTTTSTWTGLGSPNYVLTGLNPATNVEYQMCVQYYEDLFLVDECASGVSFTTTGGTSIPIPPPLEDNTEFGAMFNILTGGSTLTKMLMGFFLVIGIIFIAVGIFGKNNMQMGTFGIMIFALMGTIISTAFGLFPSYILIIMLVGSILLIVMKQMFFAGASGGD